MADPIPAAGPADPSARPAATDPPADPAPRTPVAPPKPEPAADASLTVEGDTGGVEVAVETPAESATGTTKAPESYWSGGLTGSLDFDKYWGEVGAGHDPAAPYPMSEWRLGLTGRKNWRITENGRWSWGLQASFSYFKERSKPRAVEAVLGDDVAPAEGRPDLTTAPQADPGEEAPDTVSLPGAPVDTDGDGTVDAPGDEVEIDSEDIGYTDTVKYQPQSWGLELALGVPFTFLFNPSDSVRVGLQAGPVVYGRKGWYIGGHDIGAPHAEDSGYFSRLNGYYEVGGGLRGAIAIQTPYVDIEPNVTWTPLGHRWVDYTLPGYELSRGLPSAGYSVSRVSAGIDLLFHGDTTPEQVAAATAEAPEVAPPPAAVAKCEDFDDGTLTTKLNAWKTALYKDPNASPLVLKDEVRAGLKAIGMADADIDSLAVRIRTFHVFNGATGILPANPPITRDVVLTVTRNVPKTSGGTEPAYFILWDKTGLAKTPRSALKPLEASTLVDPATGWIAENGRYIEKKAATEAAISKFNTGSYKFAINYPKAPDITTLSAIADVAAFEAALNRSGIFSDYAAAKANMDIFVTAMGAAKDAVVYLAATTDTSGNDADNQALSERRAAVMQLWLKVRGLQARAAYGLGEDAAFIKTERNAADKQANRAVRVVVADKDSPLAAGLNPNAAARALIKADLTRADAAEITVAVPGKAAEVAQVSPVKIADRILLSTVPTGDKPGYEEGAACATLVISAEFYMTDGTTPATGLPEAEHTLLKPAQNLSPGWLDEPERPEAPAGAPAVAEPPPAAAGPEAAAGTPYKDYDAAEEAIKTAESKLTAIASRLKNVTNGSDLKDISAANPALRASIIPTALGKKDEEPKLAELIEDLNDIKADIAATSDDDLDTFGFWVSGDDNRKELNGMVDAQIARATKHLDALRKFLEDVEKLKAALPAAAATADPPADPAAGRTPAAPVAGTTPAPATTAGPIVKKWSAETIKMYGGGGSIAANIGTAEVEIESDLTADQLKGRVRVQIEGSPTRGTVNVVPVTGRAKTFKVSFSFHADKNVAKNVELFDMQPGTPDTPIYKGHIAVTNATPAIATFKAGAKPAPAPAAAGPVEEVL